MITQRELKNKSKPNWGLVQQIRRLKEKILAVISSYKKVKPRHK